MKLEVTAEQLRKYSIFLGTPMYGGQCNGVYAKAIADLSALCTQYGIELKLFFMFNESLVQRARNYVADMFLASNCTHLMFVDSDIGFNPHDVLALLGIQITNPDTYQIIAAPYPKKSIAWEKVVKAVETKRIKNPFDLQFFTADFVFNPIQSMKSFKIDEPVEISETGTGFMLIPREVFVKFAVAYPEQRYIPDHLRSNTFDGSKEIVAYFDCKIDPVTKRYLSEDYFFCASARKIGIHVHLCPWMELQHVGSYTFKGSMAALAAIDVTPTANAASNQKNYNKPLTNKNKRNIIRK